MSTTILGKISFLNGQIAKLSMGSKILNYGGGSIDIKNGIVTIIFNDTKEKTLFELYHISYDLINNFLLGNELNQNRAIIFIPETLEKDGTQKQFDWDVFEIKTEQIDIIEFGIFLAGNPIFRQVLINFHTGLVDMRYSPAHFYRAIEVLRGKVATSNTNNRSAEWNEFKLKIGLNEEEKADLICMAEIAKKYRHGITMENIDHLKWAEFTKKLIIKTYNYLKKQQAF